MSKVSFIKGTYNSIQNRTLSEGQLLFATDTGEIFLDTNINNILTRVPVGGKINEEEESEAITGTLLASNWTAPSGSNGVSTYTYTDENIKDQIYLIYHIDAEEIPPNLGQWNRISNVVSTNGSLIFTTTYGTKPTVDLTFVAISK